MDPKYCFLIPGDDTSFFFFISFFFVFLIFYVIINFYKNYFIVIFFFMKIIIIFSCSGMFRVLSTPYCKVYWKYKYPHWGPIWVGAEEGMKDKKQRARGKGTSGLSPRPLQRPLRWCYTGRFATTIFSATQRGNVGTMLEPFETMLQRCVTLKIVVGNHPV